MINEEFGYTKNMKFGVDSESKFVFPLGHWSFVVNIADEYGATKDYFVAEFKVSVLCSGIT